MGISIEYKVIKPYLYHGNTRPPARCVKIYKSRAGGPHSRAEARTPGPSGASVASLIPASVASPRDARESRAQPGTRTPQTPPAGRATCRTPQTPPPAVPTERTCPRHTGGEPAATQRRHSGDTEVRLRTLSCARTRQWRYRGQTLRAQLGGVEDGSST